MSRPSIAGTTRAAVMVLLLAPLWGACDLMAASRHCPAIATADLNGDGVPDVVLGSPWYTSTAHCAGRVVAFDGKDGSTLWSLDGQHPREGFGAAIAAGGDVNEDGTDDLLVQSLRGGQTSEGRVRLLDGKSGAVIRTHESGAGQRGYGSAMTYIGDWTGDGVPDYAIGAYDSYPDGTVDWQKQQYGSGEVLFYSGSDGGEFLRIAGRDMERFGSKLCATEDLDSDGIPDLACRSTNDGLPGMDEASKFQVVLSTRRELRPLPLRGKEELRFATAAQQARDESGARVLVYMSTVASEAPDTHWMARAIRIDGATDETLWTYGGPLALGGSLTIAPARKAVSPTVYAGLYSDSEESGRCVMLDLATGEVRGTFPGE